MLQQMQSYQLESSIMLKMLNAVRRFFSSLFHKPFCTALLTVSLVVSVPALAVDLRSATVQDINRAFDAGTLTSEELVRRYLARIEARRPIAVLWV